jgi:hypothetical protein
MNTATIGHNNPPDPIDQITAAYEAERMEAENWTDGTPVENEAQMKAVDALRAAMRQWRLGLEKGQKDATAPLRAIYQAELDRWKPTIEDAKRIEGCLVATLDAFKRKLAAEKAEAERKARAEAEKAMREAEEAARKASSANLDAQREADAKKADAEAAIAKAKAASKDTVKGLRTVTRHEVTDHRAALKWIALNDRDAITAFVEEYARVNYRQKTIDGVKVWDEKEAF